MVNMGEERFNREGRRGWKHPKRQTTKDLETSTLVRASFVLLLMPIDSALCLVLHRTAPLDVSTSLIRMTRQIYHGSVSQHC